MLLSRSFAFLAALVAVPLFGACAQSELHTVTFDNRCNRGTPVLRGQNGQALPLTDGRYTSDGPLIAAIAYLQTGSCGDNGENCLTVETTLWNSQSFGQISNTGLSLIPPHQFNIGTAFTYTNGCDGRGLTCSSEDCSSAAHNPNDTGVRVLTLCQADNVDLIITFC
ncbi:hypothetical protein K488DRAFT_78669 [Vararia minispora EC-137]|uniref:Uncharacterized protein n=1 Tax=Vararia minispora EC-137 TaxID=1314806 RepID=A0ACB8QK97_9AGAM|nr:hypothetical protein K488DRAFT_78669 [Vararia minispora EC-137]